ncbi:hypothetical protein [Gordonia soli]|uniref:Uncharacterized protein n=1 Tax=Gordonia soli NBRC 108243 TaxID=1223545 RepID=M0QI93_9ACTN|nr:hypothetical protein [Gordonia soli]GAC68268.1 hypothetical protein GS4_14_00990 [Gordonia soli NBRC 108243]
MKDPNSAIPTEAQPALWRRYDEWRGRRHLDFNERYAGQLPQWRNRRTFRRLVIAQIMLMILAVASAVTSFFTGWFYIPFVLSIVGSITVMSLLRIVTGSVADTPASALDEIQAAQRNSARSMGFFALYSLMFIPYVVLVWLGTRDEVDGSTVYGVAVLLICLMVVGALVPSLLVAWWMDDPDPEDFETYPERSTE